jgi:hypothetical protein
MTGKHVYPPELRTKCYFFLPYIDSQKLLKKFTRTMNLYSFFLTRSTRSPFPPDSGVGKLVGSHPL